MWIVSSYIDPLIHKYLVTVFNIRTDDIHLCSLAYNFDVFLSCSNPSQVHDAGLYKNTPQYLLFRLPWFFIIHLFDFIY